MDLGVNLSKSAWHYRLQSFVYGKDPHTNSLCPYFWSTLFALFFFPTAYAGSFIAPYIDEREYKGYYSSAKYYYDEQTNTARKSSNLGVGFQGMFLTVLTILMVICIVSLIILGLQVLFTPSGAIAFGIVIGVVAVLVSIYFISPLLLPYLFAVKDQVCPLITWKE